MKRVNFHQVLYVFQTRFEMLMFFTQYAQAFIYNSNLMQDVA